VGVNDGEHDAGRLVDVDLGVDAFEAATIVEACRADGFDVELLEMDRYGTPGFSAFPPHRMLVREADLESVNQIVNRSFRPADHDVHSERYLQGRRRRRIVARVVAAGMLAVILLAVVQQVAGVL